MDWLKKVFSDPGTLAVLFTSAVLGLIVGAASGFVQRKHGGWSGFFTAVFTGIAVAIIVGLGVKDYIQSETARLAIVGAAAVISDDIWAGLRAVGRLLREDPLGTVGKLLDVFRGKSAPKPSDQA